MIPISGRMSHVRVVPAMLWLSSLACDADSHEGVMDRIGIRSGLAVPLGSIDGTLEASLTSGGRMLVHGLALSDTERNHARLGLLSQGLYGLACVSPWRHRHQLPYATNLVNALVADLDV